jgi:hypothetical protein
MLLIRKLFKMYFPMCLDIYYYVKFMRFPVVFINCILSVAKMLAIIWSLVGSSHLGGLITWGRMNDSVSFHFL